MSFSELLFFSAFILFIVGMLVLDLGVFSKKNHIVSFKEAAIWSGIWVALAIGFYLFLYYNGDLIHGIENYAQLEEIVEHYVDDKDDITLNPANLQESVKSYRENMALEFITGYLLEYSLSADNIFVIILIFASFAVKEKYFKKVLLWGILGAVVMRFIFIFLGSALIQQFHWILYIFGGFLIYSGIKIFFDGGDDHIEPDKHPVVRFVSKYFRVFPRYLGDRFFISKNGKFMITPLFLVVLIIEFTDLLFAVDSVPAVFAVTKDPYVVFFSNIFAIMGLRSMFFFLSNIMHLFHYLKAGLSILLVFIGLKMAVHTYDEHLLKEIGFKSHYSLFVILGILAVSMILSLLFPPRKEEKEIALQKEKAQVKS